ncbi:hypothetical protein ASF34_00985 [Methylobacterium sp. Leaf106]|nr:hypothetical protein ASF34_00985 [Methylobacterium sp. Leaf106]
MRFGWGMGEGWHSKLSYVALHDQTYAEALAEWEADKARWDAGERPEYASEETTFEGYYGKQPDPKRYRPFSNEEATWFQLWETVSEGTPVSPPFATLEELAAYLAEWGDFWDQSRAVRAMLAADIERLLVETDHQHQFKAGWGKEAADAFCKSGWAPSMVIRDGEVLTNPGEMVRV